MFLWPVFQQMLIFLKYKYRIIRYYIPEHKNKKINFYFYSEIRLQDYYDHRVMNVKHEIETNSFLGIIKIELSVQKLAQI